MRRQYSRQCSACGEWVVENFDAAPCPRCGAARPAGPPRSRVLVTVAAVLIAAAAVALLLTP